MSLGVYLKVIGSFCSVVLLAMIVPSLGLGTTGSGETGVSLWIYVLLFSAWLAFTLESVWRWKAEQKAITSQQESAGNKLSLEEQLSRFGQQFSESLGKELSQQLGGQLGSQLEQVLQVLSEKQQEQQDVLQEAQQAQQKEWSNTSNVLKEELHKLLVETQQLPKSFDSAMSNNSVGPVLLELEKQLKLTLQQQSKQHQEQCSLLEKQASLVSKNLESLTPLQSLESLEKLEVLERMDEKVSELTSAYQEARAEASAENPVAQQLEQIASTTSNLLDKVSENIHVVIEDGQKALASIQEVATGFKEQEANLLDKVESGASERQGKLLASTQENQQVLLSKLENSFQEKETQIAEVQSHLSGLVENMTIAANALESAGGVAQANQAGLQASVDMLQGALVEITEHLEKQVGRGEKEELFLQQLTSTLTAFHEKASEVLIDSATKTREILVGISSKGTQSGPIQESLSLESESEEKEGSLDTVE